VLLELGLHVDYFIVTTKWKRKRKKEKESSLGEIGKVKGDGEEPKPGKNARKQKVRFRAYFIP
jgi:hypothetical protein